MNIVRQAVAFSRKLTLMSAAFILAVSSLTAAVPFILSPNVGATTGYTYNGVSYNQADWWVDRQTPSGGWGVSASPNRVVTMVNQNNASTNTFYKTEGVSTAVPALTTSLEGRVYVNPDWNTKPNLRVGFWGVTNLTSWPIIEYSNFGGDTTWRVWDTVNGGWTSISSSLAGVGAGWYGVEILINSSTNQFVYFVNDVQVATLPAGGATSFTALTLNSYNEGTGNAADNYAVDWRDLSAGRTESPVISTAPVYVNASQANNLATWTHSGENVASFEYREYRNMAEADADTDGNTSSYWVVPKAAGDRSQVVGQSWTGEKTLYYRVVAIDIFGNRSAPSGLGTVIIDKVAPTVSLPEDSGLVNTTTFDLRGTVMDAYGISNYRYQILDADKNNLTGALASYGYSRAGGASDVDNGSLAMVDLTGLPDGTYTIRVWAFDNAGNRTGTKNVPNITTVTLDTTAPTVDSLTYSNGGAPTYRDVTATLTLSEPIQDVAGWTRVGENEFTKLFTGNESGSVAVYDLAGNEAIVDYEVSSIDRSWVGGINSVSGTTTTPTLSGALVYNVDRTVGIVGEGLDLYIDGIRVDDGIITGANGVWSTTVTVSDDATHEAVVYLHDADPDTDSALVSLTFVTDVPPIVLPEVLTGGNQPNGGLPLTTFGAAVVLGESDEAPLPAEAVQGTSTEEITAQAANITDNTDGTVYGIAWYWWLAMLAALAGIVWAIVALVRGRTTA